MIYILATSFSSSTSWFRGFLFGINESIYKFISKIYTFMIQLAQQGNLIIENTSISDATSKIYSLIGIIMLFRLGIILLRYIADPDKTMDKNGVGSKIISRVITVLALLVLMPTIFTQMYKLQEALFTSNFMTNFFVSDKTSTDRNVPIIDSTKTTYSTVPQNKNDLVCVYYLDSSTNRTCIQLPGDNISDVSLSGYSYSNSDYNFCPSRIAVNKTQEKIYLLNSQTSKYILLDEEYINDSEELFSKKDSCIEETTLINTNYYGLRFMLPATLEDYEATSQGTNTFLTTSSIYDSSTDDKKVSLEIVSEKNTYNEENPANYVISRYLGSEKIVLPDDKSINDVYKFEHPLSMTINIDALISNNAKLNDIKGTLFSDTIMMSFITPNVATGTNYDSWIAELDKLSYTEAEYMIEENQIKYSVIANLVKEKDGGFFLFEYSGLISLIAGLVVLVMLIAAVFKVAIRLFKLIMLEIIAPVPVVLYLDPNDKSAAGGSLGKWASAVVWTYLDVFIRILVILFVAMIIGNVAGFTPEVDDSSIDPDLLKLFILFGALMFVNVGPEFILSLFGKKYEKGGFNPLAQMKQVAGLGVALGTVGGGVKGLSQGGLKGGAAGLYLGARGSLMAGDKGLGLDGIAAGRNFVGKSLSDGPDSSGGFFQRMAQQTAAGSLRAKADNSYKAAKDFKTKVLDEDKKAFDEKNAMHNIAKENLSDLREKLTVEARLQSSDYDPKRAQRISDLEHGISVTEKIYQDTGIARADAIERYNNNRTKFNEMYDNYKTEINKVNEATGKAQTQFVQEKTDPTFKKPDKLV